MFGQSYNNANIITINANFKMYLVDSPVTVAYFYLRKTNLNILAPNPKRGKKGYCCSVDASQNYTIINTL